MFNSTLFLVVGYIALVAAEGIGSSASMWAIAFVLLVQETFYKKQKKTVGWIFLVLLMALQLGKGFIKNFFI